MRKINIELFIMNQPIIIYLIGFAGTGKYTIAKEIAQRGYKLVDNQLINNPIFSLLNLDGTTPIPENAWTAIHQIRKTVFHFISQDISHNYVLTNELLNGEIDHIIYTQVKEMAEKKGSLFIPVKLLVSEQEHRKRLSNAQRKERFKETTYPQERFKKGLISIDHPHLMVLDVSPLSAFESAECILHFTYNILKNLTS